MPMLDASSLQISDRHLTILLGLLKAHVPHATVWAYGSRVDGPCHEGSDLDLVLLNPVNADSSVNNIPTLRSALQDSSLPFLVDVHDWALLPDGFRQNIQKRFVQLQLAA